MGGVDLGESLKGKGMGEGWERWERGESAWKE